MPRFGNKFESEEEFTEGENYSKKTIRSTSSFYKKQSQKYAWVFIANFTKIIGATGDECSLFAQMVSIMDNENNAKFTPMDKKNFVLHCLYANRKKEIDINDPSTAKQAARRFSQIIASMIKKDFVKKVDTYTFKVNPNIIAYGYDKMDGVEDRQHKYLTGQINLDVESGKMTANVKGTESEPDSDSFEFVDKETGEVMSNE